jgi:hypothetical protein
MKKNGRLTATEGFFLLKTKALEVSDSHVVIKILRVGQFHSHVTGKRLKTVQTVKSCMRTLKSSKDHHYVRMFECFFLRGCSNVALPALD